MINKIDDGSATLDFKVLTKKILPEFSPVCLLILLQDFCFVIKEKTREMDTETHFKVLLCSTLKILGTVKTKQED